MTTTAMCISGSSGPGMKRSASGDLDQPTPEDRQRDIGLIQEVAREINGGCLCNFHVAEVFNPARFRRHCGAFGLQGGVAVDVTLTDPVSGRPWDMNQKFMRQRCMEEILAQEPWFVILSPRCIAFTQLMSPNKSRMDPVKFRVLMKEGLAHIAFSLEQCSRFVAGVTFCWNIPGARRVGGFL